MPAARFHVITAILLALSALVAGAAGGDLESEVRRISGTSGIVYVVDENDRVVLDRGSRRSFIPASTLKVFTTLLAAEYLGLDSRFTTEFFADGDLLLVRGLGDPFLISEELDLVAAGLKQRLQGKGLAGVAIDNTFFAPNIQVPGAGGADRAYAAPNSATAVNFNTVYVKRVGAKIRSAEVQTPLTPLAEEVARRHQIRSPQRISLRNRSGELWRYAGELIAAKLRQSGVEVGSRVQQARAPAGQPFYVHHNSRTVAEVCREMLYHSNNHTANQVFLAVGAAAEGPPASMEKSAGVAARYIAAHPELRGLVLTEGSGLSYQNRATARALAALLRLFAPHKDLLRTRQGSPSKTGTLRATESLIGYLDTARHGTVRFVISLQGAGDTRRWQIVDVLRKWL